VVRGFDLAAITNLWTNRSAGLPLGAPFLARLLREKWGFQNRSVSTGWSSLPFHYDGCAAHTVTYTFDAAGRFTQAQDVLGTNGGTYGFIYDNMDRLTEADTTYAFLSGLAGGPGFRSCRHDQYKWVPRPSRSLRRAGTTNAYATGLCGKGQKVVSAASLPALAKNARTGHPQRRCRTRTSSKAGPPALAFNPG